MPHSGIDECHDERELLQSGYERYPPPPPNSPRVVCWERLVPSAFQTLLSGQASRVISLLFPGRRSFQIPHSSSIRQYLTCSRHPSLETQTEKAEGEREGMDPLLAVAMILARSRVKRPDRY